MSLNDPKARLGRAGLKSLMRDPRYLDGTHPEHDRVLAMVTRGFELVFEEPPHRAGAAPPAPDLVTRSLVERGVTDGALRQMPAAQRAALGRTIVLDALEADGVELPRGFREVQGRLQGEQHSQPPAPGREAPSPPVKPRIRGGLGDETPSGIPRRGALPGGIAEARLDKRNQAAQVAERHTTAASEPPAIPAYRDENVRLREQWPVWFGIVSRLDGLSSGERRAFMELFAAEGGADLHRSGAFGGIKPPALALAKEHEPAGLAGVDVPEQMSLEQLALAYKGFVTDVAERYGGRIQFGALTDATAATVIDAFFFPGQSGGPEMILEAVGIVTERLARELPESEFDGLGLEPPSDRTKPEVTMRNLQRLDRNGFGRAFREALTELRLDHKITGRSKTRVNHFRFADEP